jgi:hypothetical protein
MSENLNSKSKIARVFVKSRLGEEPKDSEYWRAQSYEARLTALELIRHEYSNWKLHAEPGFQIVYSVIKRE